MDRTTPSLSRKRPKKPLTDSRRYFVASAQARQLSFTVLTAKKLGAGEMI